MADQLTLFKQGGADYAQHITASPHGFKKLFTSLRRNGNQLKSVRKLKRQPFELVILAPFLVILLPTTLVSFTKLRFRQSF